MPAVLDRPPDLAPPTQTEAEPEHPRWRLRYPWVTPQTRTGAPTDDGELLIDNRTSSSWLLHIGYHALDPVLPFTRQRVRVLKTGQLAARQVGAPVGSGYLTASLRPEISAVEIRQTMLNSVALYDLRLLERARDAEAPPRQ